MGQVCVAEVVEISGIASSIPLLQADLAPMSFVTMDNGNYINGLIGIYELNNVPLLREVSIECLPSQRLCQYRSASASPNCE